MLTRNPERGKSPSSIPSIDKGKHACQRVFPALFALFALAGASPPAAQKPKITRRSIAGRCGQFCRSRNVSRQGKARREYCRIVKGLDAVWAHFCPSKPCLPSSIDGNFIGAFGFTRAIENARNRSKKRARNGIAVKLHRSFLPCFPKSPPTTWALFAVLRVLLTRRRWVARHCLSRSPARRPTPRAAARTPPAHSPRLPAAAPPASLW